MRKSQGKTSDAPAELERLRAEVERLRHLEQELERFRRLVEQERSSHKELESKKSLAREATFELDASARIKHLQRCSQAMYRLSRSRTLESAGLSGALQEILRESAEGLGVSRVGIWLYEGPDTIVCRELLEAESQSWSRGTSLARSAAPAYFEAIAEQNIVAVSDVHTDLRVRELVPGYLEPLAIESMLDTPIWAFGHSLGVLCHEHRGPPRTWSEDDVAFACAMADLVALAIESDRRIKSEQSLRESEAMYRRLVENQPGMVYSVHLPDGRLVYAGPEAAALLGYSQTELLADPSLWANLATSEDAARRAEHFAHAIAAGSDISLRYRVVRRDRCVRWVRDSYRVLFSAPGEPFLCQGVLQDIHEETSAELARKEAERRFTSMLEKAQVIAVMLDAQGRVTFVNDHSLEIIGLARSEVLGRDWSELVVPGASLDRYRQTFRESLEKGSLMPYVELPVRTARGGHRDILWSTTILLDVHGQSEGLACLGLDLTERKALEAELQRSSRLDTVGRLASATAHDFSGYAAAIAGFAELSLTELPENHGVREYLRGILSATELANGLTRQLLTYVREQPPQRRACDLHEIVREVVGVLSVTLGADTRLEVELGAPEAQIMSDPLQIKQVLTNLVNNARDALAGKGCIHLKSAGSELSREEAESLHLSPGRHVSLLVSDDGPGFSPEARENLFVPFYSSKTHGTGLGLALARNFVQMNGGHLRLLDSARGACFELLFPVQA